jgi:acid phosphatase
MRITALKAAVAALLVVPVATPAMLHLLQSSSAAPMGVQNYTTPEQAGCPTTSQTADSAATPWEGTSDGTTYDARGVTFTQAQNNLYPVWVTGANSCFVGGTVAGTLSKTQTWEDLKNCCNAAGVMVDAATKLLGVRLDDIAIDGVRIRNTAATQIDDMYASYVRDDCVSNITHGDLVINDSLFDGCRTGIDWRSNDAQTAARNFQLQINDSLFSIAPMPQSATGNCTASASNGKGNGAMWKGEGDEQVELHNVVIRQDLADSSQCKETWPKGSYDHVTFVWTNSRAYPGTLPTGVKLTHDVSVWDNAKASWLARHADDGTGGGTPTPSPTSSPTSSPTPSPTTSPTPVPTSPPPSPSPTSPPPTGSINKVLLIVEENHNASQARPGMPYLAAQAGTYGDARNYVALADKSLPNYLALTAGSMFGISKDIEPSDKAIHGASLFSELRSAGKSAKSYMETMPHNCDTSPNDDPYSNHHNPWIFYTDDQASCQKYDVPMGSVSSGALASDVSTGLPNFSLVVPDKMNDAHDGTLSQADNWLKKWLPAIEAGPDYQAGRLAIVVNFDEGADTSKSRQVLTVVISPYTKHVVSSTAYDHYSLLRTLSNIFGVTPLRNAASAKSMRAEFHI